ncbi:MAG: CPBP family intramembrane glutamic endopeptidase [Sedimenticola sp.]
MPFSQTFRYVLIGLASVLLLCALKNYIVVIINGTPLCPYLCPAVFEQQSLGSIPGIGQLYLAQKWLQTTAQEFANRFLFDHWGVVSVLVATPIIEEAIYRGPMYLARKHSHSPAWWLAGMALVLIFALSHGRIGIAVMPIIALGAYNLWLIAKTQRFWPVLCLHFLYNFIFLSLTLSQSMWIGD